MHPAIKQAVKAVLRGRCFRKSVDLGCGTGDGGEILRSHTGYLIGVDVDVEALRVAENRGFYDRLVHADARAYGIPWGVDSVFLFDVIEHFPKQDGLRLLRGLGNRFVMITTPWWSTPFLSNPEHVCVWSAEELRAEGFTTASYSFFPDLYMSVAYGGFIVAWR